MRLRDGTQAATVTAGRRSSIAKARPGGARVVVGTRSTYADRVARSRSMQTRPPHIQLAPGAISARVEGTFDAQRFMRVPDVRRYFSSVAASVEIQGAPDEEFPEIARAVEAHCPVSGILHAAGVETQSRSIRGNARFGSRCEYFQGRGQFGRVGRRRSLDRARANALSTSGSERPSGPCAVREKHQQAQDEQSGHSPE